MERQKFELFKPGPLYKNRFEIVNTIKQNMKSGDILYRYSDVKGPLGLPFCRIVCNLTKSEYSHAAILFIENNEPHVLEINDQGTLSYRLLDWIDTCYEANFSIYRLKNMTDEKEAKLLEQINKILNDDPDYDFTFSDPNKFYCTESVITIYKNALNVQLDKGYTLKEFIPTWLYITAYTLMPIFKLFGTSMPFDQKLFFVGNEKQGMIASTETELVVKITNER